MNSELARIIKQFNGNVLGIGLDDKLVKEIGKNNCIKECNLLSNVKSGKGFKKKKVKNEISIYKIRKYFKKKSVDFVICNYDSINKYLKTFVKDSIYINSFKIYYYGNDLDDVIKKYQRYNTKIEVIKKKNYTIIEIDTSLAKNNIFKELIYSIIDFTSYVIELIGDVLMS